MPGCRPVERGLFFAQVDPGGSVDMEEENHGKSPGREFDKAGPVALGCESGCSGQSTNAAEQSRRATEEDSSGDQTILEAEQVRESIIDNC